MTVPTRRSSMLAGALAACLLLASQAALACTSDAECDDGLACTGVETCNLGTSSCESTGPVVCDAPTQCQLSNTCQEPSGTCVATPKADFVICDDGDDCTLGDTCQSGVCAGGPGDDTDGDGDCDDREVECNCNPNDAQEVCHLPNRLIGGIGSGPGEVLIEYHSPTTRRLEVPTDDACATAGQCVNERCATGKVRDVCTVDADCNQPPLTCRVIVNWGDVPDLVLQFVRVGFDDVPGFTPTTRGCSRKVDVTIDSERTATRFKFRASGTVGGRPRRDREALRFIR
jgi:hypothetical protein